LRTHPFYRHLSEVWGGVGDGHFSQVGRRVVPLFCRPTVGGARRARGWPAQSVEMLGSTRSPTCFSRQNRLRAIGWAEGGGRCVKVHHTGRFILLAPRRPECLILGDMCEKRKADSYSPAYGVVGPHPQGGGVLPARRRAVNVDRTSLRCKNAKTGCVQSGRLKSIHQRCRRGDKGRPGARRPAGRLRVKRGTRRTKKRPHT
jgi:hypothetical protein